MATHVTRRSLKRKWRLAASVLAAFVASVVVPSACTALPPDSWYVGMAAPDYSILGFGIGVYPWTYDGWDGGWTQVDPSWQGVLVLQYNEHGPEWPGRTGSYDYAFSSPIPAGGSKTWSSIYMWAQNTTPPDRVAFGVMPGPDADQPVGYIGHLVLDYVPVSANWTGPTEFWLELDTPNLFTMPTVTVTDPADGIRMHLTVYAVPEPSCLAVVALGIVGAAIGAARRRLSCRAL